MNKELFPFPFELVEDQAARLAEVPPDPKTNGFFKSSVYVRQLGNSAVRREASKWKKLGAGQLVMRRTIKLLAPGTKTVVLSDRQYEMDTRSSDFMEEMEEASLQWSQLGPASETRHEYKSEPPDSSAADAELGRREGWYLHQSDTAKPYTRLPATGRSDAVGMTKNKSAAERFWQWREQQQQQRALHQLPPGRYRIRGGKVVPNIEDEERVVKDEAEVEDGYVLV